MAQRQDRRQLDLRRNLRPPIRRSRWCLRGLAGVYALVGGAFRLGGIPSPARGVDCHLEGGLFLLLGMQCQLHGKACHLAGKRCQVVGKGFQVMDLACFWSSKK